MAKSLGDVDVACAGDVIYVKVERLGSAANTECLVSFLSAMLDHGYVRVILDLSECTGMDSTFMGSLASISQSNKDKEGAWFHVINASSHNFDLLERLGLTYLLDVRKGQFPSPQVRMHRLKQGLMSDIERATFIRDVHLCLATLNKKNQEIFGPLLDQLSKEIEGRK